MLDFQEHMDKIFLKLSTIKSSVRLNMKQLREENDVALNSIKGNGTTDTIEELDNLCQNLENKKVMICKLVGIKTCLWVKLKALQHSSNEESSKSEKGSKTIKVLQKYLKLAKAERNSADNSTFLHSDSLKINTGKLQGVNIEYGVFFPKVRQGK